MDASLLASVAVAIIAAGTSAWSVLVTQRRKMHTLDTAVESARAVAAAALEEAASARLDVELLGSAPGAETDDAAPTAPDVPGGLVASSLAGECVLFAGTGVAAAAGQPTWREALLAVLAMSRERHAAPIWERLVGEVRGDQYDLVSDLLVDRLGREELFAMLREVVEQRPRDQQSALLDALQEIPFAGVITNLWDDFALELFEQRKPHPLSPEATTDFATLLRERRFFALPAFGGVSDDSLLLTNAEVDEYLDDHGAFKRFLASIFGTRSVLFVGTGVSGIEQLLRSTGLRGPGRRRHYALVPRTAEAELHKPRLERRYNVQLLLYAPTPHHTLATEFVQTLAEKTHGKGLAQHGSVPRAGEALRSVYLQNIGPFEEIELEFAEDWTVLLGDNGCGKSTVLRSIALAIAGDDERALAHGGRLLHADAPSGRIEVRFDGATFETRLNRERSRVRTTARQITPVQTGEWLALGFPPVRGLSIRALQQPATPLFAGPSVDDVLPLVVGAADERLDDVQQWLLNAFATDPGASVPDAVKRFFSVMSRLHDPRDRASTFYAFSRIADDTLDVLVDTPDGEIPLKQLSQGMLSVLSWTGALITRLEDLRRDGTLPDGHAALVLIDELDAHLHPAWQRTIAGAVRAEFPMVQVIATTHSPLVVGGLGAGKLWRLHRDHGRLDKQELDPHRYLGRRVDQILAGLPFDETSPRDPETEEMLDDYVRYVGRTDLTDQEAARLAGVSAALRLRMPSLEERDEVQRAQELVARAADAELAAMPTAERERVLAQVREQLQQAITGASPKS